MIILLLQYCTLLKEAKDKNTDAPDGSLKNTVTIDLTIIIIIIIVIDIKTVTACRCRCFWKIKRN